MNKDNILKDYTQITVNELKQILVEYSDVYDDALSLYAMLECLDENMMLKCEVSKDKSTIAILTKETKEVIIIITVQ